MTGVNGSGKSHLLEAIVRKNVVLQGLDNPRVVHFNYETFKLENEAQTNALEAIKERNAAWQFFSQAGNTNIKGTLTAYKKQLGKNYELLKAICEKNDKNFWNVSKSEIDNEALWAALETYRTNVENHFENNPQIKGKAHSSAIFLMTKKQNYSLDDISEVQFHHQYEPYTLKNNFLPMQLGKIFTDYYSRYETNQYNLFRNHDFGDDHLVFDEAEFQSKFGPKPWDVVNEILQTFSSMPYRVNSPEKLDRNDNYQVKLIHEDKPGVTPEFSALSSGERVLMALVASIFKSSSDGHFPDVLLLDEIDASLHPSMMQNLLRVVQDVFLQNDVNVILVTHSPTTIALAPDDSVFVMNTSGVNRIEKKEKSEALAILTEGFATLEQGLKLFDQIAETSLAIISEGRNIAFIQRALEVHGVSDVQLIAGVENRTGKSQLKTLYDFFSKVPHKKSTNCVGLRCSRVWEFAD